MQLSREIYLHPRRSIEFAKFERDGGEQAVSENARVGQWDVAVTRQSAGLPASRQERLLHRFDVRKTLIGFGRCCRSYIIAIRLLVVPMDTACHMTRHQAQTH